MTEDLLQKLITQYRVPVHIQKHMKKVAAVALYLGQLINREPGVRGKQIDLIVLRQAALLHDILKICDFKNLNIEHFQQNIHANDIQYWTGLMKSCSHIGHVEAAYNLLREIGEDKLALIIRKHRYGSLVDKRDRPITWEEKLLYYADKRVKHDQIVSISERIEDGRRRYLSEGNLPANEPLVEKSLRHLEKEICSKAKIKPEEITEKAVAPFLEQ